MRSRFDLAIVLTYYAPYLSGLTEVAKTVAEGLAGEGWKVAVVASQHERHLPTREYRNGVSVFRSPVIARLGRGVISPRFAPLAGWVIRQSAVANLHLPMLEAGPVAKLSGATPLVCNHHDDVWVPGGTLARAQMAIVERSVRMALSRSVAVVVNNVDHAQHSRHWPILRTRTVHAIPPPCRRRPAAAATFRDGPGPHIGFLGRIAAEKGLDHLVRGFANLPDPRARLLIAGDHAGVAGGGVLDSVRDLARHDHRVRLLGKLTDDQIAEFYASLDVFALTSVAEESFGIVQAEAMLAGVPSVVHDLPGMREPVRQTGFGRLVPPRDPESLASALAEVATWDSRRRDQGASQAAARFGIDVSLAHYQSALLAAASGRTRSEADHDHRAAGAATAER